MNESIVLTVKHCNYTAILSVLFNNLNVIMLLCIVSSSPQLKQGAIGQIHFNFMRLWNIIIGLRALTLGAD